MNAVIKQNRAYCPFCGKEDYRVTDYKQIGNETQITGTCKHCDRDFEYFLKLTVEKNIRYVKGEED